MLYTHMFHAHLGRFCYLANSLFSSRDWSVRPRFSVFVVRVMPAQTMTVYEFGVVFSRIKTRIWSMDLM